MNNKITQLSPVRAPLSFAAIIQAGKDQGRDSNIVFKGLRWEITLGGEVWHIGSVESYENVWTDQDFGFPIKLTVKQVKTALASVNVTITRTPHAEFKVRVKGSPAGHGYFTTQLDDALATGLHMAKTGNTIQI